MTKENKRPGPKGSSKDDRALLLFMADLRTKWGIGIEEAARQANYFDQEFEIPFARDLWRVGYFKNKSKALAAKYRRKQEYWDRLGEQRARDGLAPQLPPRTMLGEGFRESHYREEVARYDALTIRQVVKTLEGFSDWVLAAKSPAEVASRKIHFAEQLDWAAKYLRTESPSFDQIKFSESS